MNDWRLGISLTASVINSSLTAFNSSLCVVGGVRGCRVGLGLVVRRCSVRRVPACFRFVYSQASLPRQPATKVDVILKKLPPALPAFILEDTHLLGWCFIYYYDYNLWPRVEYRSNLCFTLHERTSLPLPCFGWSIGRTYAPLSMKPGS